MFLVVEFVLGKLHPTLCMRNKIQKERQAVGCWQRTGSLIEEKKRPEVCLNTEMQCPV